jgi:hypothetical protein
MPLPRLAWPARAASPPALSSGAGNASALGSSSRCSERIASKGLPLLRSSPGWSGWSGWSRCRGVADCAVLGERAGGRGAAAAIAQHRLMPSSNWETGIRFDASTLHGASPPRCTEHRRRPSPAPAKGSARPQAQRSRPRDLVPTQRGPEERAPRHKFPLGRRG